MRKFICAAYTNHLGEPQVDFKSLPVRFLIVRRNCLPLFGPLLHLQTQLEGKRNQSMKRPFAEVVSRGSSTSNLCHLYFCSQPQSGCALHLEAFWLVADLLLLMVVRIGVVFN